MTSAPDRRPPASPTPTSEFSAPWLPTRAMAAVDRAESMLVHGDPVGVVDAASELRPRCVSGCAGRDLWPFTNGCRRCWVIVHAVSTPLRPSGSRRQRGQCGTQEELSCLGTPEIATPARSAEPSSCTRCPARAPSTSPMSRSAAASRWPRSSSRVRAGAIGRCRVTRRRTTRRTVDALLRRPIRRSCPSAR